MSKTGAQAECKPWGEAVATFFTCLALGPPIGGLAFSLIISLTSGLGGAAEDGHVGSLAEQLMTALFVGLFAVPFSYLVGGLQAAATGVSLAAFGWFRGRPPLWFACLTIAVIFAGAFFSGLADNREIFAAMLAVHVVSTLLCWLIIRTYWWERVA